MRAHPLWTASFCLEEVCTHSTDVHKGLWE
jgi:hypothetical protein